jgi:hypothetical protein
MGEHGKYIVEVETGNSPSVLASLVTGILNTSFTL